MVYLFMTGPNLPPGGGSLTNTRSAVITGQPETFTQTSVNPDNTWEYRSQTGASGTVTVQAGSEGLNTWAFPLNTATFVPDTYLVQVTGVAVPGATGTSVFSLSAVTPTSTPTPPPTIEPTPPTTSEPTPMPTPTASIPITLVLGALIVPGVLYGMRMRRR